MSSAVPAKSGNRTVYDAKGHAYTLMDKLGEGGQGIVCLTDRPGVLVKIARHQKDEARQTWHAHLRWIMHQALEGLPIARPKALIVKPRLGYVMELMDGLEPLSDLMQRAEESLRPGGDTNEWVFSGGLKRRLKLLARLARVLSELHGRGMAYGDLSPTNIFVSKSALHHEVWLIDCDNISSLSRDSGQALYSPDYGAPEVVRGEALAESRTDSWSFAVIAFRVLALAHPMEGDLVVNGEPDLKDRAQRGELPWVDHPTDRINSLTTGLPREIVTTTRLRSLFQQAFGAGLGDPGSRPSMAEWAGALDDATAICITCPSEPCSNSIFSNRERKCPICGTEIPSGIYVALKEFFFIPLADLPEGCLPADSIVDAGGRWAVDTEPAVLRSLPRSSSLFNDAQVCCTLELVETGLRISPEKSASIWIRRSGGHRPHRVARAEVLKHELKTGTALLLHLDDPEKPHVFWRLMW